MTFKVICDSCGKESKCPVNYRGDPINPDGWWSRVHDGKKQHACSRECLDKLGGVVAPW